MRPRFAVLGAVISALVLALVPGLAAAAPRHNHGLTINATPNPIIAGEGVLIYGQLNGDPVGGQTIRLYHRVNPSHHFSLIGTTKTNAFGFYEFTREEGVVLTNRSWFVRGPDGSHSRTVHERVAALVSITASSTSADTRTPITFTGKVTPNHAFERVFLQERTGSGDDYRTLKSGRLDGNSNYSISYRWVVPGERDVRVVFRGDDRNIAGESDPVSVTIQQDQIADFTINTSTPIIPEGSSATISGVLDLAGTTTPEPNTGVTLWGKTHSQLRYRALQSTQTAADGSYSFTVQPQVNTNYQVRTTLPPSRHTAVLFEGVRDVLQLSADSTSSTVGGKVTFTGSVVPDKAGHLVFLQRLGADGDWHAVEVRVVRRSSTFQFVWRFGKAGSAKFRARIFSDDSNVGGASPPVTINVMGTASPTTLPPAS
jgi:hypothetical protein